MKSRSRLLPVFELLLVCLVLVGVVVRYSWVDWSQGTNLHPDEYGLTNTLTQLSVPHSISDYFNTRISSLSPYHKYDESGSLLANGPDNRMRWGQWPIIIIRSIAELTGNTGYNEIRLLGRHLSASADILALVFLYLLGRELFGRIIGLLAASFSSMAVLQIQQSHFMTVDNYGILFSVICIYALVRTAKSRFLVRQEADLHADPKLISSYHLGIDGIVWVLVFSLSLGMAIASRINLLPLYGLLPIAVFLAVADLRFRNRNELRRILVLSSLSVLLSGALTFLTFRVVQPMSFRASSSDTHFWTFAPNPDWVDSMKVAMNESSGIGGGPPSEQWANRTPILFPLINIVFWGMGLTLGTASFLGIIIAAVWMVRGRINWRLHLIPLVWVSGYFLYMGTRWVKSIRYFLPIYPILCLYAAWLLWEFAAWYRLENSQDGSSASLQRTNPWRGVLGYLPLLVVTAGTALWAFSFIKAVYLNAHTRIEASEWIYENVPAGAMIANENWDEGLPLPSEGINPFGPLYQGVTMEVRWYDSVEKRDMFIQVLSTADYIILPSQRGIWSICRLPLTYPMTMEYYRSLFDGELGFELAAVINHPLIIGPLFVSDLAGDIKWGEAPGLPLFNYRPFAAEEAFSVYDHPPVWVFKKSPDFNINNAIRILSSVDLSKVIVQSPKDVSASLYSQ